MQQEELPPSANTSSAPCTYLMYPRLYYSAAHCHASLTGPGCDVTSTCGVLLSGTCAATGDALQASSQLQSLQHHLGCLALKGLQRLIGADQLASAPPWECCNPAPKQVKALQTCLTPACTLLS